ncbi:hypothetical protein QMJ94_02400 [Acinetobacter baumannii]|nr:hypothetical protein [Acinetobacter baumannii]
MADEIVTRQQLVDAGLDAESLQKFISGTEFEDVLTRLGMQYPTLAKAVLLIHQLGESKIDDVLNDLKIRYLALSVRGNWTANTAYEIKDLVFVNNITYICLIDHTSSSNFQDDLNSGKWIVYQGVTQVDLQSYVAMNKTYAPVLGSPVKFKLNPLMASFLYGISDPTHKDDDLNNFRGLNNPDAYHDSNVAIGAVSFGRNNPPFAYLSLVGGHDCVPFGVASFVFGAGSCTGNPDVPNDGANFGYCSLAVGKNTQARGRISNAMGERNISASRYSSTDGYGCIAGPQIAQLAGDVESEGAAARAHGYKSEAYGNFAFAYGAFLKCFNGAQVLGRGINEGSTLNIRKRGLGLGYNVDVPTIFCQEGQGVNGGHAPIGFNTDSPRNKYHFALKSGDTLNYVIDEVGSNETVFSQETVGKLSNGNYASLHNIVTYHTNENVASAIVEYRLNSTPYLKVDQSLNADFSASVNSKTGFYYNGVKVVGQRQAALAKLPSDASLADVIAKMNEIIEGVTNHGLFATPT